MQSKDIREKFLQFFEKNNHKRIRSSSLIPMNDPTLLFINAGMNQFKDIFVGNIQPEVPRATSVQKCMRVSGKHNDLENVGRTARHHTFFEMLGNFSFGDYFKHDAIRFGWELINDVYQIDIKDLWITVFKEDDEAYNIWAKEIGFPEERIVRLGRKDNFWSMGDTGPCGPCSEIHVDQGDGPDGIWKDEDIYGDSDRFLEIWNLVFMQYDRAEDGTMTPLPKPSVDTGAGLERITAIKQGVQSNYETDLFLPLINKTAQMCGKKYHANSQDDTSLQVIADHVRASTFLIADGMLPSNEFRGYVLRRIMRRAIRHGKRIGFDQVFMPELCEHLITDMGDVYPELTRNRDFILNVVREEEKGFRRTLASGLDLLNDEIQKLEAEKGEMISGETVFKLYDTYGFPVDLTRIIAEEQGKKADMKGFDKEMAKQRERGRASWKGAGSDNMAALYGEVAASIGNPTEFTGYQKDSDKSKVLAMISNGQVIEEAIEGMDVELVVANTPFYAESGGQVGDRGLILSSEINEANIGEFTDKASKGQNVDFNTDSAMVVLDTQRPVEGLVVHKGRVLKGTIKKDSEVSLYVDFETRNKTKSNHSATHILQYALRKTLGDHVKQSGSWVGPDRLRFDFTHFKAVDNKQIMEIEKLVNEKVIMNVPVITEVKDLEQAQKDGAIAFFGEKYGDTVRVVSMTNDAVELCGGTHTSHTGNIGLFKIFSESSIASGVRRIEATTGMTAVKYSQELTESLLESSNMLSTSPLQVPEGIKGMIDQQKTDRKQIEQLRKEIAKIESASLVDNAEEISGVKVLCSVVRDIDAKAFRDYGQEVLDKLGEGVVFLAAPAGEKVNFLLGVSENLRKAFPAGKAIGASAKEADAKGGGRPDMAQAGGGNPEKIDLAFNKLKELVSAIEK